ncbi:MAG: discoidin domain-containing protein [Clostridia bacterium]|nr:discoidin domain-containing protein [Clostridia bacterium]
MKKRFVSRLACLCLALLMIPLAAFPAMAEETESYNFAKGQTIEADNNYFPPEGFFDASFLVDGEWMTIEGDNLKLGWNTDPFSGIGETDPVEITVTLDGIYALERILLYPMKWTNGEAFPRDFELLGSMDGSEWFSVYEAQKDVTAAAEDNVSVTPKEYTPDAPVSIRYFRIRITRHSPIVDATGAATSALGEIELYGCRDTAAEEAAAKALAEAKATAKTELETYRAGKDNQDYREAQIGELDATLAKALETVENAMNTDTVAAAVETAKKALDAVKTDAQLTAEETEAPTEAPTEPDTKAPDTDGLDTDVPDTDAPATVLPGTDVSDADTRSPATDTEADGTAPAKGCGSALSAIAVLLLTALGAAWALRRREEA